MVAQLADTCTQSLTVGYDLLYEPKYKIVTVLCSSLVFTGDKSMDGITTGMYSLHYQNIVNTNASKFNVDTVLRTLQAIYYIYHATSRSY
jgi:hypothetical protein